MGIHFRMSNTHEDQKLNPQAAQRLAGRPRQLSPFTLSNELKAVSLMLISKMHTDFRLFARLRQTIVATFEEPACASLKSILWLRIRRFDAIGLALTPTVFGHL